MLPQPDRSHAKVLVVDDDPDLRRILVELLTDEGFLVHMAQDGQEALDLLQHESGWIILLDVTMPHLDGRQVLQRLQAASPVLPAHQVILMSAGWLLERENHLLKHSLVRAALPKPFDLDVLLALVKQVST